MKILVTGGCGFVGANICIHLKKQGFIVSSMDNLSRNGSKQNLKLLINQKIKNYKIDIFNHKKILKLPKFDLIIDCCAEASVEISKNEIDRVINTNLIGTYNILKKSKIDKSKIIFLSSSRVNSIDAINNIIKKKVLRKKIPITAKINENFNISGPKSIYGFTKLASEMLIQEFSYAFNIKFIINRCGVISGPLQFGKQDQGFISHWVAHHLLKKKLKYIGYGGYGQQVRDVLHIDDLTKLISLQIKKIEKINNQIFCVGGSSKSFTSLRKLTSICEKLTKNKIKISRSKKTSIYDIPYFITDNKKINQTYKWVPNKNIIDVVSDTYKWMLSNKKFLKNSYKI
ncbi:NAD-dependent epimerase/dehydratase family protein [Candidatus Pelagibacter sp.]|jgi:CDP-paratose 2-epimerase|nr:NAD-dependent epimerase/dehydratase family protein [Candidatus Pelagibacter sp.]